MERDRDREAELWIGATQLAATEEVPRDDSRLAPFGAGGVELRHFKELARAGLFGRPPALMRIGRFRVLERVGQGGMGVVYAAFDEQLDRKVAVKLLQQTEGSAGARKRLLREAQAMARLTHENVVAVYEVGEHDHEVFVAMEFIRGQSLDRWLATPRSWREIISVFARAGAGLRAAHDAGLIHRDFKPHNVMRSEDGEIKVLDFGLVQALESEDEQSDRARSGLTTDQVVGRSADPQSLWTRLTQTGAFLGTPAYMSPEQYSGGAVTERSDQFSFCVALYEGLYRQLPFAGKSVGELVSAALEGAIRPPPPDVDVPAWVERIVRRGLSHRPEDRFPDMATLLDALERNPQRRRRRWLTSACVAILTGLAGYGAAPAMGLGHRCDRGATEREALWSEVRQAELAASFADGGTLGVSTWEHIRPALDHYVAYVSTARDKTCEEQRRGNDSDELYELRSACIDQRVAGLETLLNAFASASPNVVERAALAVDDLASLDFCDDRDALLGGVAPPKDPVTNRAVARARLELERARVEQLVGDVERARTRAASVRREAEVLGYQPLSAEAWLREGAAHQDQGAGEPARTAMSAALLMSIESRHRAVAAEAAARLISIDSELRGTPSEALESAEFAAALADAAPDPWRAWLLANNVGFARWKSGDLDGALTEFQRALTKLGETPGWVRERALTECSIGQLHLARGEFEPGRSHLELAIEINRGLMGDVHPTLDRIERLLDDTRRAHQHRQPHHRG